MEAGGRVAGGGGEGGAVCGGCGRLAGGLAAGGQVRVRTEAAGGLGKEGRNQREKERERGVRVGRKVSSSEISHKRRLKDVKVGGMFFKCSFPGRLGIALIYFTPLSGSWKKHREARHHILNDRHHIHVLLVIANCNV